MAEVPDHLVPTDGLTNANIRLAGLDTMQGGGGAIFRFDMYDEEKRYVGTFPITVDAPASGGVNAMVKTAYAEMRNVLRQWIYVIERVSNAP